MYGASSMHLPTFSNAVFWVELFLIHIFSDLENYDAKYLIIEKSEKKRQGRQVITFLLTETCLLYKMN